MHQHGADPFIFLPEAFAVHFDNLPRLLHLIDDALHLTAVTMNRILKESQKFIRLLNLICHFGRPNFPWEIFQPSGSTRAGEHLFQLAVRLQDGP
ncbi:Uncharacterised protein [Mycobacteroides abscessus subsp. abscessus]|nr:Uncharacterised protein [Mycobacteroides abscessus subsp. abscessus]